MFEEFRRISKIPSLDFTSLRFHEGGDAFRDLRRFRATRIGQRRILRELLEVTALDPGHPWKPQSEMRRGFGHLWTLNLR